MSDTNACSWPEQDAIDKWWHKHEFELKRTVTEYRLSIDAIAASLSVENHSLRHALERILTNSRDADCGDHCSNACMYCQARDALKGACSGVDVMYRIRIQSEADALDAAAIELEMACSLHGSDPGFTVEVHTPDGMMECRESVTDWLRNRAACIRKEQA